MPVKETLCTNCVKRKVCKYVEDFEKLMKQADQIDVKEMFSVNTTCREWTTNQITNQTFRGTSRRS